MSQAVMQMQSRVSEKMSDKADSNIRENYGIIAFSHLRWNFVWQRPQQFLSRFADKHRILFIEEPIYEDGIKPRIEMYSAMRNVTVAVPHLPHNLTADVPEYGMHLRSLVYEAIVKLNFLGDFDNPLLWYYCPMQSSWSLGQFGARGVVYDCMDELSQFRGAPKTLIDNEKRLIENADIVFTGGYELFSKKSKMHKNVHVFGCGVDYEHFCAARLPETEIPSDVAQIEKPIAGWFGVIDERMDYKLLESIARARSNYSFVLVGPVVKVDPNSLPSLPNIKWIGQRDYADLPRYCKSFDVCMMPFALNESTEYINPTKALEYFATGLQVVSTPVRDVVRQYKDIAYIAATPEEYVKFLDSAIAKPDQNRINRGIKLAQSNSWEATVSKMQTLISQSISKSSKRSRILTPTMAQVQPASGT